MCASAAQAFLRGAFVPLVPRPATLFIMPGKRPAKVSENTGAEAREERYEANWRKLKSCLDQDRELCDTVLFLIEQKKITGNVKKEKNTRLLPSSCNTWQLLADNYPKEARQTGKVPGFT